METTTWEQKLNALTHILTSPTTTPQLHSQLFVATQIPCCYLNWDYPPLLCSSSHILKWSVGRFLKRALRFGLPETSWRSKCPYQMPPPLVLAKGVEQARWDDEGKRIYARTRTKAARFGRDTSINPFIPFLLPNFFLLSLLLWDPIPIHQYWGSS